MRTFATIMTAAALALVASSAPARAAVNTVSIAATGEASIYGKAATYAAARADSAACAAAPLPVGQVYDGARYGVRRTILPFDLSAIPAGATILYARLDVDVAADYSGTNFAALVFRPAVALPVCAGGNREANYDAAGGAGGAFEGTIFETTPGASGGYSLVVDHTALAPGASVGYAVVSSRDVTGNAPTGAEWVDLTAGAARLVVVYAD